MSDIELANVNGRIAPADQAFVPVNDHGFLYGDSVYETVRTYAGRPFLLASHLDRLRRSAKAIRLRLPWDDAHITTETIRILEQARLQNSSAEFAARIITTRGAGPMGYDLELCPHPNLVILTRRLRPLSVRERDEGISAVISKVRRNPIEALDPRIKSSNLLNNILAAQSAKDAGAEEAILFNTSGDLAEGTLTNVFFVSDGVLHTPSLDCGLLGGLTRDLVLDLARSSDIRSEEGRYGRDRLENAEEVFLTSTTREIVPVASLDGRPVGPGRRGPLTQRLQALFRAEVESFLRTPSGVVDEP